MRPSDVAELEPEDLAQLIVRATRRLGELGEPAQAALLEAIAGETECDDFDAGVDLLEGTFNA